MNVVSQTRLAEFWNKHNQSRAPLRNWYTTVSHALWTQFDDVKQTYRSADQVGKVVVFDVGDGYRVVAHIAYTRKHVYIKEVMTHAEYDRWTRANR